MSNISCQNLWMPLTGNKYSGIYFLTNKRNGKIYIGMSNDILRRVSEHRSKKTKTLLSKDIQKFGFSAFDWCFLELVDDLDSMPEIEKYWIAFLNPEYNMNSGGKGNSRTVSEEVKKVLSYKNKEYWEGLPQCKKNSIVKNLTGPKIGHLVNAETRNKLKIANLGKKQSTITIKKRSISMKISALGNSNGNKKVEQWKGEKLVNIYDSIVIAAKSIGVHPSNITKVLKGKQRTAGKFNWKYNK